MRWPKNAIEIYTPRPIIFRHTFFQTHLFPEVPFLFFFQNQGWSTGVHIAKIHQANPSNDHTLGQTAKLLWGCLDLMAIYGNDIPPRILDVVFISYLSMAKKRQCSLNRCILTCHFGMIPLVVQTNCKEGSISCISWT